MAVITVQEIVDRARSAADMQSSNFVSETEWIRWFNVENKRLQLLIAKAGWVVKYQSYFITADGTNPASYAVTEPMIVLGVWEMKDNGYRRLKPADGLDVGFPGSLTTGDAKYFAVASGTGGNAFVTLFPAPLSGTYLVLTVREPPLVTTMADTVEYPGGWEDYIVYGLARRALSKEESPTSHVDALYSEAERHVNEMCWDRTMAAHQTVRNVDKLERGWTDVPTVPSREEWLWV